MAKRIRVRVGDVVAEGFLYEEDSPRTVQAFWDKLPILNEKTIQVRWSGDAWRTEGNYELLTRDAEIENQPERLEAGDIAYYPGYNSDNLKICFAYGKAQWLAPFMEPVPITRLGKLDTNVDAFVAASQRIIFDGPLGVEITRIEE